MQWQPSSKLRTGLAWKSGTTIRTESDLTGSASALFRALQVDQPSSLSYKAEVWNHFPQAFAGGATWQTRHQLTISGEAGMTAWGQAFQEPPFTLTDGANTTVNSLVGSPTVNENVPVDWNNQLNVHAGGEYAATESVTVRVGHPFRTKPVPSSTLTPLTAAIMRHGFATGAGWKRGKWETDVAYQIQLPNTVSVQTSAPQAGEYKDSSVRVLTQSATLSMRRTF